jgi:hypothetical protein
MRIRLALITTTAFLAGLGMQASAAQAVTFGADLGAAANNPSTCASLLASSCTFYSGAPGPSFYAPVSGTVTRVRVKVGPVTGPMQIVVMRSLYQNRFGDPGHPYFACCFVQRYGPTFTPAANTVTPVSTSLPMVADPTPPPNDYVTSARIRSLSSASLSPKALSPSTISVPSASYSSMSRLPPSGRPGRPLRTLAIIVK